MCLTTSCKNKMGERFSSSRSNIDSNRMSLNHQQKRLNRNEPNSSKP